MRPPCESRNSTGRLGPCVVIPSVNPGVEGPKASLTSRSATSRDSPKFCQARTYLSHSKTSSCGVVPFFGQVTVPNDLRGMWGIKSSYTRATGSFA